METKLVQLLRWTNHKEIENHTTLDFQIQIVINVSENNQRQRRNHNACETAKRCAVQKKWYASDMYRMYCVDLWIVCTLLPASGFCNDHERITTFEHIHLIAKLWNAIKLMPIFNEFSPRFEHRFPCTLFHKKWTFKLMITNIIHYIFNYLTWYVTMFMLQ